jgi:hypothetical protein
MKDPVDIFGCRRGFSVFGNGGLFTTDSKTP